MDSYDSEQRLILQRFFEIYTAIFSLGYSEVFSRLFPLGIPKPLHLGVEVEKTMENHPVDPTRKDASSKRGPGEKHRTSKQTRAAQ